MAFWIRGVRQQFGAIVWVLLLCWGSAEAEGFFNAGVPDSKMGSLKKGTNFVGMNLSVNTQKSDSPSSLIQNLDSVEKGAFEINAFGGHFIKDLWAVGGKINYTFSESDLGFSEGSDRLKAERIDRFTSLGGFLRVYLPMEKAGRFSLFIETSLDVGYGKSVVQTTLPDDLERKISEYYVCDLGVTPGIMAFINDGVAVEVSVNVMGLKSEWGDYDFNDGEQTGNSSSVDLDFTVKLLTLYIGLTYYF